MKKNWYLPALILCALHSWAQDSLVKYTIGLDVSYAKTGVSNECVLPAVTFNTSKHSFFAGGAVYYIDQRTPNPLSGAQLGYQFSPNGKNNRFNLFFEYDCHFMKGSVTEQMRFYGQILPLPQRRVIHITSLNHYLSFGFRCRIVKRVYFSTAAGAGAFGLYKRNYTYYSADGSSQSAQGSLKLNKNMDFNRFFKISLGYEFIKIKKR